MRTLTTSTLKVTTVGNSVGVVLPKELLEKLRVSKGDTLHVVETPNGVELMAFDPEFARQMDIAERVMREDRDVLRQLAEHGGADGVRDIGLLESALGRPRHLFAYSDPTPDVATMAAPYGFGIAKNHPFLDGNKRTAFVVCRSFMIFNGVDLTATREARYQTFLDLAAGIVSEAQLVVWLQANSKRL